MNCAGLAREVSKNKSVNIFARNLPDDILVKNFAAFFTLGSRLCLRLQGRDLNNSIDRGNLKSLA